MSGPLMNRSEPIPGYKLLERLGSGGFGEVWKCEAPGGILKAIKFVYGDLDASGDEGKPAEQELKALDRVKQIRHPFVLSLERYDIVEGRLIIITELADRNLWDRFRECRNQGLVGIPREELLRYLEEAAEALDMMNDDHQLQHLDVKPQNLFLVHKHIKVADFGLVKVFEGIRATVTGGVTPVYAAPETFEGWISRFCDQYSLAIVYQELLTGVRPFSGSNTKQLLLQHLTAPPNLTPLPEPDRAAIGRSLAKKPDQRFPSCLALIEALQQAGLPPPKPAPSVESHGADSPTAAPDTTPNKAAQIRSPKPRPTSQPRSPQPAAPPPSSQLTAPLTERAGDGVLMPALVIGVGHLGTLVVHRLRGAVADRFGTAGPIPTLRTLTIDTDPEATQAMAGDGAGAFDAKSHITAKLNRPSYYSRRDGVPSVDNWLANGMLYRLPRIPVTNGVRAYGRLALLDFYRPLELRIQAELEAALDPAAFAEADRATKLGLRSSRPRICIVASPAGGTGGGMIVDLAYLARKVLRRLVHASPDVLGILLVPPVDSRPLSLANACATLTEIAQLSQPDTSYEVRTSTREPALVDRGPPFERIVAVPLGKTTDSKALRLAVGQAAGILVNELVSPLGRAVDVARIIESRNAPLVPGCVVGGTYRFGWPRRQLIRRGARKLTEHLLHQWTAKNSASFRPQVQVWLEEQWAHRRILPELLTERLHDACIAVMGQSPDAKFDSLVAPLTDRAVLGTKLDAYAACQVLDDVFDLVGKPIMKGETEPTPGVLQRTLAETTSALSAEYDQMLAEMGVHFIEQPGCRFPAAEECLRQMSDRLQQLVSTYESLYFTLEREVTECYSRLFPLIGTLETGSIRSRKSTIASEVTELLRAYPKKRYQAMVAGFVLSTYRGMVGAAPEYLRELNYSRERMADITMRAERGAAENAASAALGPGRDLFPGGQDTLEHAAGAIGLRLTSDEMLDFDGKVQQQIRRQFKALVSYCLESSGQTGPLLELIENQAEDYLSRRLGSGSVADIFLEHFGTDEQAAHRALAEAVEEAVPAAMVPRSGNSLTALAVPDGPAGELIAKFTEQTLPYARFIRANSNDDLVIYREVCHVPFTDLVPLSPAGREAYKQMLSSETPPHARVDVKWELPAK